MKTLSLHPWDVSPAEARRIQERLRARVELEDRLPPVRFVAGADVAFDLVRARAIAGVVVYRFCVAPGAAPRIEEVERVSARCPLTFPYIPGLLSFREAPALLAAFQKLRHAPGVIFCDGHGYAHPRRFGIACHLGVLLDCPTIGCAKSRLIGTHAEPPREANRWSPLCAAEGRRASAPREILGAVIRLRRGVRPVFVSQGHRVSLARAIELVLAVSDGFRIPRPTREADRFVNALKRASSR